MPDGSGHSITPEIKSAIESGDLAVVFGKAFFWEMCTGNNGQVCASCHFHAGTDRHIQNTLHPGGKDEAFFKEKLPNIPYLCWIPCGAATRAVSTTY